MFKFYILILLFSSPHKAPKSVPIHQPASSAPVCCDPSSFKSSTSSISSNTNNLNLKDLSNEELATLVLSNKVKDHELEKRLDPFRAVDVRRLAANHKLASTIPNGNPNVLEGLPSSPSLDYGRVYGANCEIVVGYIPLPVGLVGPLTLNGATVYVPMATTEGCLVASTNRGAKAISQGGGAHARIVRDGITRAPCVRMNSAMEAADLKVWCEEPHNFAILKQAFESTTGFGKLQACHPTVAGKNVYLRLVCFSGDAMGMNMVSKGSLAVIETLQKQFSSLQLVALSGNMCTDKKAAATNWLHGRGKSVVVEAVIPKEVVRTTLKTTVKALVHTNLHKNLIGSAMAGSMGGFNAHASNIVTAIFLATGQDPAQNVESSNCITLMEETEDGNQDLWISCTMPSIEVGTVGGGTSLEAQSACLEAIGCKGGGETPGENARKLATVVAAATMAGELSLLAALAANTLVQAHMTHNRKPTAAAST
jgi:hydroxymethylglutaryl-CoA reductase (NADPH)